MPIKSHQRKNPNKKLATDLRRTRRQLALTEALLKEILSAPARSFRPDDMVASGFKVVEVDPIRDSYAYGM